MGISEEEVGKLNEKLAVLEYEENKERALSKDRLIKSEEEKNLAILNLKGELKKVTEARDKAVEDSKRQKLEIENIQSCLKSDKQIISKYEMKAK